MSEQCDHWVGTFSDSGGPTLISDGIAEHCNTRFKFCPKCGKEIDWNAIMLEGLQ